MERLAKLRQTLAAQDAWRARCLNLIASENVLSPEARDVLQSDFLHRYAEGHPGNRYYEGTRYIDEIETAVRDAIVALFGAAWADVRPISGTVANEAVFSRLVPHGATVVAHPIAGGGHISHARIGALGKRTKNILAWPTQSDGYSIDVPKARDLIAREKPALAVLGRSLILFPEPVAELADVCREHGTHLFYDGAHVLGLVAAGRFQAPLAEGADVLCGSTHKTFFGPQRGVVLAAREEPALSGTLDKGVFPGSSSNHHLFSLPSLLVATWEIEAFGVAYADATIANARALARALVARGFNVPLGDRGWTASHQVALDVGEHGGGYEAGKRLCSEDIVCNMNLLPGEEGKNALRPRGLRLGVQEMTRMGMGTDEMDVVAGLIHDVVVGRRHVAAQVHELRARFADVHYRFGSSPAPTRREQHIPA